MKKKGFTLIEVIAVIAIIAILSIIAVTNFIESYKISQNQSMIIQENEIVDTAGIFLNDYCIHPLSNNKGMCSIYSLNTSDSNKKYTCLSALKTTNYIDPIEIKGNNCSGFIIYNNEYKDIKAYLNCGDAYQSSGINNIMDEYGNKIIQMCNN